MEQLKKDLCKMKLTDFAFNKQIIYLICTDFDCFIVKQENTQLNQKSLTRIYADC